MWLVWSATAGAAEECVRQPVDVQAPLAGATALAIRGWLGNVLLVRAEGEALTFRGEACGAVKVRAAVRGAQVGAKAKIRPQSALTLTIGVPVGIEVVTFSEHRGPMRVDGLDARVAVVSSDGPVTVARGGDLRVSYSSGTVTVDGLSGDLIVDRLVGTVDATGVAGDATLDRVTGDVSATEVGGNLTVTGNDGEVHHENVRGAVHLGWVSPGRGQRAGDAPRPGSYARAPQSPR